AGPAACTLVNAGDAAERVVRVPVGLAVVEILDLLDGVDLNVLEGASLRPVGGADLEGGVGRHLEGEAGRQLVLVRELGAGDDVRLVAPLREPAPGQRPAGGRATRTVGAATERVPEPRCGQIAIAELLAADADLVAQGADRQVVGDPLEVAAPVHVGPALAVPEDIPGDPETRRQVGGEDVRVGGVGRGPRDRKSVV